MRMTVLRNSGRERREGKRLGSNLLRGEVAVAADVLADLRLILARELGHELSVGLGAVLELIGLDHHIGGVAACAVHPRGAGHDAGVRQGEAAALLSTREEHGGVAEGGADCEGVDLWPDVVHGIEDGVGLGVEAHGLRTPGCRSDQDSREHCRRREEEGKGQGQGEKKKRGAKGKGEEEREEDGKGEEGRKYGR